MADAVTKQSEDFSAWYNDVVLGAELADYSPVKGSMIIRPYGYRIWELLQQELDRRIKVLGAVNAYFPLLIPEQLLRKESDHIRGFAPHVAWVTHGGDKKLAERLAVRPTSETIMYTTFAQWIHSHRDLPLKINQWANVVRWEMRTRLFLRTLEFLWQEGHTVHAADAEAVAMADAALAMYREMFDHVLGIFAYTGRKSRREQFPGALYTLTAEALMRDRKALQMGTSHHLGQHFAKAFGITFLDASEKRRHPWQTSWGVSTRLIGGLVMAHGDDRGLRLPPALAPHHIVIVPIGEESRHREEAAAVERELTDTGFRVHVDYRTTKTPGWKFSEWELKGVPVRLEIGDKEIDAGVVTAVRRDQLRRERVERAAIAAWMAQTLASIQETYRDQSRTFTVENTRGAETIRELTEAVENGFARALWCEADACEERVQKETGATLRLIEDVEKSGPCAVCGRDAATTVLFARAY